MSMEFEKKLALPMEVKEMYPMTLKMGQIIEEKRAQIQAIFEGRDDRLLLIIGPCSADNEDSVIDYISRLCPLQEKVKEKIFIVPRIYTNKPRTTGEGYKGMLHQPDPNGKSDLFKGIAATRHMHLRAVRETGFACADEMLYPENYRYLDDVLSYVAVGARSVEDQQHRMTVSGMDIPAGMKNPTSGDLTVMFNSITAAQAEHNFIYRGWDVSTDGNDLAHVVLRGSVNKHGNSLPNYHYEDLLLTAQLYERFELKNPAIVVDCNHANSGKKAREQIRISHEILHSRSYNQSLKKLVKGLMIESYLVGGRQDTVGGPDHVYGQSITDPCLGWEESEKLIYEIYSRL